MTFTPVPPPRIARLPRNHAGYPVPWFVATVEGVPDFRVVRPGGIEDALRFGLCWLCGQRLGANAAFILGPMCTITRVSPEPPSHRDCALYAARACPFLTNPNMRRRTTGLPEDIVNPDGEMITRNPGVVAVWVSRKWAPIPGYRLFNVGDPMSVTWLAEGRNATRREVLAAIDSGMPILRGAAEKDPQSRQALQELGEQHADAMRHLPAEVEQ